MATQRQRWLSAPIAFRLRYTAALINAGALYWITIYPQVRRELKRWEQLAHDIPDSVLRSQALHKLNAERLNPEAAAFFAVLAPRLERARVVRLIVAFQLLYDYLDAVNELPACAPLEVGLLLHRSLMSIIQPNQSGYCHPLNTTDEKGAGYMCALVGTCRSVISTLPAVIRLTPQLTLAINRVCEAQSHNHAVGPEGEHGLIGWCSANSSDTKYLWWEIAAGGISCLGVHALFALAADPKSTASDAELLDAAYFPSVCALSALLDSLSDHYDDIGTANHSFTARYRDSIEATERFSAIAVEASELIVTLRHHHRHAIILTGIVAFYISSTSVRSGFPTPVVDRLVNDLGFTMRPMSAVMRLRRKLHGRSSSPGPE